MLINWKKGLFSSKYELYQNDDKVGELTEKFLSSKSNAYLKDTPIQFAKKGVLNTRVMILATDNSELFGEIDFSFWGNKATITIGGESVLFRSSNFWGSKWSIDKEGHSIVTYHHHSTKGEISSDLENPVYILAGLYLSNYYVQTVAIVAAMVAIIAAS